jgi:PhzF family phenazine biosynthesis protein
MPAASRPATRRFLQLDVFAHAPGAGNPLAVVVDASGLDDATMQAFANWTNLSETIFLLPPGAPGASYRVRIFTPHQELPFAGHPSVGAAHAALDAGLAVAAGGRLLQECAAGLLPVRVDGTGADRCIYVRAPKARQLDAPAQGGHWTGVLEGLARGSLPIALFDNGPRWWLLQLAHEAAVRQLVPAQAAIRSLLIATGAVGLAVFAASNEDGVDLVVRCFCPADGIPEDPVTGSANACIAEWLRANDALPARSYVASQGREVGRDGRVHVEVDADGEAWIGGLTRTVVEGSLVW